MSKVIANQILKEHGLKFVTMSTSDFGWDTKCYADANGKRVKGIYCACKGPLTVTTAADEKIARTGEKLHAALRNHFVQDNERRYVVSETSRSQTLLRLLVLPFPTYTRSADLDDSYLSWYIVPVYETVKKTVDTTV